MNKRVKKLVRSKLKLQTKRHVLVVSRSNRNIFAQLKSPGHRGRVLGGVSSLTPALRKTLEKDGGNKDAAYLVGQAFARYLKEQGIDSVVVDRGGWKFWGRVKALVQGVIDGGITI